MPKYSVHKSGNYTMYNYNEQGLSKSRNRLLENMTGDIGVITDDDISFTKDALKVIEKAYKETDADIITFNLPEVNDVRNLVVVQKERDTPKRYPRKYDQILKRPLIKRDNY